VPSPADTPAEVLAALAAALSRLGPAAGWYVFGAQAAIIWGRPRLTADIDITVKMEPEDPERLVRVLEDGGFRLRVEHSADFVRRTRVLPFVHARTAFPVDVVLAGPGLEELFLSRAITVSLAGAAVPVMSPEDLIVTKVLAGRPKDLEDIRGVLRERWGGLDLESIRSTLASLEEALGQSDLQPVFEREVAAARRGAGPS
jgi:hypothetical protein